MRLDKLLYKEVGIAESDERDDSSEDVKLLARELDEDIFCRYDSCVADKLLYKFRFAKLVYSFRVESSSSDDAVESNEDNNSEKAAEESVLGSGCRR